MLQFYVYDWTIHAGLRASHHIFNWKSVAQYCFLSSKMLRISPPCLFIVMVKPTDNNHQLVQHRYNSSGGNLLAAETTLSFVCSREDCNIYASNLMAESRASTVLFCCVQSCAYLPALVRRNSWGPCSTTLPFSKTIIWNHISEGWETMYKYIVSW